MSVTRALLALPLLFAAPAFAAEPAPIADLVAKVDIPYEAFTLDNGLRVLVHTDRKAPVVAVSVWYHVGSKDEPRGKTGFAHLFEHLMFNGSENAPGDWFGPLQSIGATDLNGTTWFDRTNYFQTVPTGALERTLFLESDRMGRLLGAVTQEKLTNQIGVVQNEKRQGDNQPFGQTEYVVYDALFPAGHPYRHSTIGSMADLTGASLDDVKGWFRAKYGPDNSVLVLAGDIDAKAARPLVQKWFGSIARGPKVTRVAAPIPTLAAPVSKVLQDKVPFTRVARYWVVEGVNGADTTELQAAMSVLGGLSSSRLDNALVRSEKVAVGVTASVLPFEQVGVVTISADVKPGQDANAVAARLDALIAQFLKEGPTADELKRAVTKTVSGTVGGYESVGGFSGKATALAEGLVYSNDPAKFKTDLVEYAGLTPAAVRTAANKWLSRPVLKLTVEPGERDTSPAMLALTGDAPSEVKPAPAAAPAAEVKPSIPLPDVGELAGLDFPNIERTTLSNGIPVYFVRRTATPTVRAAVSFNAGFASDPKDALGTQSLMLSLLDEGTRTRNSVQIAEEQERLGATISTGGSLDRSTVGLYALTANLAPSLELLSDVVRNPAFDPAEVERLRGQQLARIAAQLSDPAETARYVMPEKLFGRAHPYGVPSTGTGEAAAVAKITRDEIASYHRDWFWAGNAQIFVVGDTTLAALKPQLEASFGNWASDRRVHPKKTFEAAIPAQASKIYLVDRPGSGQSVIRGGTVLAVKGTDDQVLLRQANDVLGGSFVSRLNMDLRETKGWSYGVGSGVGGNEDRAHFLINAPVQTDRTGESLAALISNIKAYVGPQGTSAEEIERTRDGSIRELPGTFETSDAVLGALQQIVWLGRPDDYYEKLVPRYRAMTAAELDAAARKAIDPEKISWVVVGDAAKVKPQLDKVGLPIEIVALPAAK